SEHRITENKAIAFEPFHAALPRIRAVSTQDAPGRPRMSADPLSCDDSSILDRCAAQLSSAVGAGSCRSAHGEGRLRATLRKLKGRQPTLTAPARALPAGGRSDDWKAQAPLAPVRAGLRSLVLFGVVSRRDAVGRLGRGAA